MMGGGRRGIVRQHSVAKSFFGGENESLWVHGRVGQDFTAIISPQKHWEMLEKRDLGENGGCPAAPQPGATQGLSPWGRTAAGCLAKPNSRHGLVLPKRTSARALIAGEGLQLGNLEGPGCFHSLSQPLSFMLPLSFPQCISHSRSHSCSLAHSCFPGCIFSSLAVQRM